MGNLLLDASSPSIVYTDVTGTVTTGSFNPPANSRIVVLWIGNNGSGNTPSVPTITDSLATDLVYTLHHHSARPDNPVTDGQAAVWSAPCPAGGSMTISVTNGDAATGTAIKVMVWTDDSGAMPTIGATKENGSNTSASSKTDSVTATVTGSRGVMAYADWTANGAPTAGTGCTLTGGGAANQSPTIAYAFLLRTTADGVAASAITMNIGLTAGSTTHRWVIAEVCPAAGPAAPQVGMVPAQWWPGAGPNPVMRFMPDPRADVAAVAAAEVTLSPANGVTWEAVAVSPAPQPVALSLAPANTVTWAAVAVSPVPGPTAVTATPAAGTWAAVSVSPVPQPVALSLTAATSTWAAQPVVATPSVPVTPATSLWAAQTVALAPGQTARTITPAAGSWSAIAVTPTPGPTARTATPATASWAAVPVSPAPGATAVTVTPATATWAAQAVSPAAAGGLTVTPATTAWSAMPVAPAPGQTARTVTPATATWSAVPVSAQPSVALSPGLSTWAGVPVALTPGQTARTLTPAGATWTAVALGIPAGQAAVTVTPATAVWAAVALGIGAAEEPARIDGQATGAGTVLGRSVSAGQTVSLVSAAGRTSGSVVRAGGVSGIGGARIDGEAAKAGEVEGNVL